MAFHLKSGNACRPDLGGFQPNMPRRVTLKLREVMDGCKVCGRRMLTPDSPLIRRTCDACKAEQRREHNAMLAARRKAKRHAAKQKLGKPRCEQCGKLIKGSRAARHHALWAAVDAQILWRRLPPSRVPCPERLMNNRTLCRLWKRPSASQGLTAPNA